jgi:serine/threonine protein kinase
VKVIELDAANRQKSVNRVYRELAAMLRVRHSNVVTLRGFGVAENVAFIVTDAMTKGNLKMFAESKALSVQKRTALAQQIIEAVTVIHASGVAHRDLKPENILIDDNGQCVVCVGLT